jgi:hypothetical protein
VIAKIETAEGARHVLGPVHSNLVDQLVVAAANRNDLNAVELLPDSQLEPARAWARREELMAGAAELSIGPIHLRLSPGHEFAYTGDHDRLVLDESGTAVYKVTISPLVAPPPSGFGL